MRSFHSLLSWLLGSAMIPPKLLNETSLFIDADTFNFITLLRDLDTFVCHIASSVVNLLKVLKCYVATLPIRLLSVMYVGVAVKVFEFMIGPFSTII